jgi:hypothetical protein
MFRPEVRSTLQKISIEPLNKRNSWREPKLDCLEVVNERLHALLHRCARRWDQFVIVNLDRSGWDLVQALTANTPTSLRFVRFLNHTYLVNDAQRLSEFLHPTQVAIVAIAILSNRNVEFDLEGGGY